jgi:hypothetical protein
MNTAFKFIIALQLQGWSEVKNLNVCGLFKHIVFTSSTVEDQGTIRTKQKKMCEAC